MAIAAIGVAFFFMGETKQASDTQKAAPPVTEPTPPPEPSKPALIPIQPAIDAWVNKQKGTYSLLVYDPANQQIIGSHQPDRAYFAASIYKLYVVYLALIDVQDGKHSLAEPFRGDWSRQKCLDEAIRSSDSPCAEALLAEIGQATAGARLQALGVKGRIFPGFQVTAADMLVLLQRLYERKDLNEQSTALMLEAMKGQIYRNGLPKGMAGATVADKVGFSETPHYHDVGIVTLPKGRDYIIIFLSEGAGSRQAADFGKTVLEALNK